MVDDGRTTDGRRTDGRTTEHGYTISPPCEPDGSGELKSINFFPMKFSIFTAKKSTYIAWASFHKGRRLRLFGHFSLQKKLAHAINRHAFVMAKMGY